MCSGMFRATLAGNADEGTYFSCPFMSSKNRTVYKVHRVILRLASALQFQKQEMGPS